MTNVEKLNEYAQVENSEIGDFSTLLIQLEKFTMYMDDDFKKTFDLQVENILKNFQDNCEIITTTRLETTTVTEWRVQ